MKTRLVCLSLLSAFAATVFSLDVKGDFAIDVRTSLSDGDLLFNQEYGSIAFEEQVDDNLFAVAKLGMRYYNNPVGSASSGSLLDPQGLGTLYSAEPLEMSIDEAYFTCSNFIFAGLDLTVGKQRINWGTADKLNPTDLLNPPDFSDPLDFGKKIPSLAAALAYALPSDAAALQIVFEPYSHVARLNRSMVERIAAGMDSAFGLLRAGLGGIPDAASGWNETVEAPANNISSCLLGVKVSTSLPGLDLSANFVSRMNDLPYVKSIAVTTGGPSIDTKAYSLAYYREYELGFDASADLGFMLMWAETAIVFPEAEQFTSTYVNSVLVSKASYLSDNPYVKYTIGMNKTFNGGFYVNVQYNHGFFNERGDEGPERLQDYLVLRLELTVLNDTLKLGLSGLGNLNNVYDALDGSGLIQFIRDDSGGMIGFDLEYLPSLNLSVKTGVMLFEAKGTSALGTMKDMDLFFVKMEYHF